MWFEHINTLGCHYKNCSYEHIYIKKIQKLFE